MSRSQFIAALDAFERGGRTARIWLRDDDAIEPTAALSRLLDLSARFHAPMTIAAIPALATKALARELESLPLISVAVHGWDHTNHASPSEKKQELGLHRGEATVLAHLAEGLQRIEDLFGDRAAPMLVPPWNRIASPLISRLPEMGYKALSVFGPERRDAAFHLVNTHVDIIDWHGSRGGRPMDVLYAEATERLRAMETSGESLGILTHHLVHDEAALSFLEDFVALTTRHPACRWVAVTELMAPA